MADSARIVFYFDTASSFSYIGFEFMERYRALWNIPVDYRPFVLTDVMAKAKNSFSPYKLPYLFQDILRTSAITHIPFKGVPKKYPYDSSVALRTLHHIKIAHSELLPEAMRRLWRMEYVQCRAPESPEDVKEALDGLVDGDVVDTAVSLGETLDAVTRNTEDVKNIKGFGAPTILAYKPGQAKPQFFFGSDRFEHLAIYLDKEFFPMKQLFASPSI
ncbi:hypothetical protein GGI15_002796 [Coemansia interrupta]|uniref:DSBA-like thioredoxin domain-containing protein n=1 Tax=Coemansia interrupta TaxID=1126814 RepID=A0A9W8LKM0_9FUNG|nr:hypothetical protein GGI15_002796 [Coemansia interrupta]